ncbi:translation initiation factor IF-2 [uncultured Peptoniphilus sp.]|uniref:translation initiation factor IF-2 n=1 Tax=uncultured Peptoniphilus sp. TaxID=254354 RepID=UPI0028056FE5|nr:translation initiation factor IF-2 [uncultured Peptoniphilus sp.]
MQNKRVHALAKELNVTSKELIERISSLNIEVKNHMSTLNAEEEKRVVNSYRNKSTSNKDDKKKNFKNNKNPNKKEGITIENKDMKESKHNKSKDDNKRFDNRKPNAEGTEGKKRFKKKPFEKKDSDGQRENNKFQDKNKGKSQNFRKPKDSNRESFDKDRDEERSHNKKKRSRSFNKMNEVITEKEVNQQEYKKKKSKNNHNKKTKQDILELREEYAKRDLTKKAPKKKAKKTVKKEEVEENKVAKISPPLAVKDFAEATDIPVSQVITKLIGLGVMASQNEPIDKDVCEILADELNVQIEFASPEEEVSIEEEFGLDFEDKEQNLKPRPPVVTVMGHVDHGKTSILDSIKKSHVTSTEAGGITQHIGAYTVNLNGKKITFLDTPGHEAFTSMRLRGAQITDVAILVVAADDGVMPQTIEAISHARSAEVPIIVAINKIDKEAANVDRVKQELSEQGLMPEDWGGDTIMVPVSAHTKQGIDDLLEMILLVAEMRELKANPQRKAVGTVIEAKLDKGKGPMATVLVQNGTLRSSDFVVSGVASGRIRAMTDDKGKNLKKAGPSMPAVILGLSEVPNAGDTIYAVEDEKTAKTIADKNREIVRENRLNATNKVSLSNLFDKIKEGEKKQLDLILKGDVKGSVEALSQSLLKIGNEEVNISIVHSGVGGISESDVSLASASKAIVIGFNVRPNINAIELAKELEVDIRTYRVIYDAIDDIEKAAIGMLDPEFEEEVQGRCEVRQTFKLPNNAIVAGVFVVSGKIPRKSMVRILRNDTVIHEGEIASLKRFKDDVRELNNGYEGGITIENFNDIKEGDFIESYIMKEIKRV